MSIQDDRLAIHEGYRSFFGSAPSLPAMQILHGIALLETGMGRAWRSAAGRASNNLGAIQYKTPSQLGLTPPYPQVSPDGQGFLYQDTSPVDGTEGSVPYAVYFKRYPTLADGARDLAKTVYSNVGRSRVLEAANRGDVYGVSAALHSTRYYEGHGPTVASRIQRHYKSLMANVITIARAFGEQLPDGTSPPPSTLKRGAFGEQVKELQRALNEQWRADDPLLVVDGFFGPQTEAFVKDFQKAHKLKVDGVVGPITWEALLDTPEETKEPVEPDLSLVPVQEALERANEIVQKLSAFLEVS